MYGVKSKIRRNESFLTWGYPCISGIPKITSIKSSGHYMCLPNQQTISNKHHIMHAVMH